MRIFILTHSTTSAELVANLVRCQHKQCETKVDKPDRQGFKQPDIHMVVLSFPLANSCINETSCLVIALPFLMHAGHVRVTNYAAQSSTQLS